MRGRFNPKVRVAVGVVAVVLVVIAVTSGGSFDSKTSGENLIRNWVSTRLDKATGVAFKLTSVECPSGVKDTVGATYACALTLENPVKHQNTSGTITIHIAKDSVRILSGQDLHLAT